MILERESTTSKPDGKHYCAVPFCGKRIEWLFTFCQHHGNCLPQAYHVKLHRLGVRDNLNGTTNSLEFREWLKRCVTVIKKVAREEDCQSELPGLGA